MKTFPLSSPYAFIPIVSRRAALVRTFLTILCLGLLSQAVAQQAPQGNLFVVPPNFPAGNNISSMVVADFNGDGKMDVAVTNASNSILGSVTVLLGNGDGTFQTPSTYAVGWQPRSIAVGDFNGDHTLDIVVANDYFGGIGILRGNGDGSFRPQVIYAAGLSVHSLAVGDFNGDGKLDVAVGLVAPPYLVMLFNNGDGTFGSPVSVSLGTSASAMTAGDLNGDGKLDLVVASVDTGTFVLLGNGDGTFKSPTGFGLFPQTMVALADLNGDGRLDIITASANIGVWVWLGNGDGTFRASFSNWSAGESVAVGDLNGDGKPDIVASGYGSGGGAGVEVMLGNGDGTFAITKNYVGGSVCGALADFNGDGKLDFVTVAVSGIALFQGNGDGTFYAPVNYANLVGDYTSITTGDFNGDGKLDFAATDYARNAVSIFLGNGDDTFAAPVTYPAGSPLRSVTTGDFNGDGVLDLAVGPGLGILLGKGDGTFQAQVNYPAGGSAQGIVVGDFNNDGKMDVVVPANDSFSILLGNGDGTLQAPMSYNIGFSPAATGGMGDSNGDGNLDVVLITSGAEANVLVLLGNGDGTFKTPVSLAVGGQQESAAVEDLNRDGKLDIVVTDLLSNKVVVFLGNGDGTFQPGVNYATDVGPVAVAIGDFNGDGLPDLVVGDEQNVNLNVLIGNGDGTFQAATSYPAGQVMGIAVGDFRGGGIPDLVAASVGTVIYANVHGPLASLSPTSLSFGNQAVGTTSASETVTLTNDGTTPFTASSITTTPDFSVTGTCAGVPAGQTCTLSVAFNPVLPLTRRGALTIGENRFMGRQVVALNGTGIGAVSSLSASSLSFGPEVVGSTTAAQAVTVTNDGNAPLIITNIATSGDFAPTNTCASPLAPGGYCTVSVTFTPTIAGVRSGILTITSNHNGKAGTAQMVSLSGTATAAAANVVPALLDFGNQPITTTSSAMTVNVTNPGTSPLTISSISATTGFSPSTNCVGVLAATASCTISVTFTPPTRGTNTGTLTITSNAANSPNQVSLTGFGTSSLILANPTQVNFPTQFVGVAGMNLVVTVYSYGELPLTFTSISTTGNFTQTNTCMAGVASGGNCTVLVSFLPAAVGTASGTLNFVDNAPGTPPVVMLTGTGTTTYSVPHVGGLLPRAMVKGGTAFTLTVDGSPFGPGSIVNWNGSPRATTVVNAEQLTASILASDVAAAGVPLVTVTNPTPGGGTSTGFGFDIINSTPPLTFGRTDVPVGTNPLDLVSADFNGDGKADLAVLNPSGHTVSILLGNGDGTFQTHVDYPAGGNPNAIVVADFNNDGKWDLAVTGSGCPLNGGACYAGGLTILLSQGDGTFQPQPILYFAATNLTAALAAGDFNGDGKVDIAVALGGVVGVAIYLGKGDGTFQAGAHYPIGSPYPSPPYGIVAADFNHDGKLDLAVAEGPGSTKLSILLGNGDGTFQNPVEYAAGADPYSIMAADLNGDGNLDLAVTNSNAAANSVSILFGNGDGTFQTHVDYATGVGPRSFVLGDFNGDGKLDLVSVDGFSNTLSLLLGNGNGTFQPNQDFTLGTTTMGFIVASDFNGDGRLDLAVANYGANTVSILILQNATVGLSATSLTFGSQTIGTASSSQSITLNNTGSAPLSISDITITGDFTVTSGTTCTTTAPVAAGANCTINIAFSPASGGAREGALAITDNADGSPHSVSLTGTGMAPGLSLSSSSVSFGNQAVGTTSSSSPVTVTNTGTAPLTFTALAASGDFAIAPSGTTCSTSSPVAAGVSCVISVTFTPTTNGVRAGSLTITDNADGSPHTVALSGTGTGPLVSLSSAPTFSAQLVGTTSGSQTITLTNTGSANLTFTAITATGPFAIASSGTTCATSTPVTASATCTVAVTFTPPAAGAASGSLSFTDNAPGSPQSVALGGTGQDFTLAPPPGSSTASNVVRGQAATFTLSVGGQGGPSGTVTFTCTGAPSESTCTISPNPASPGGNVIITVTTTAPTAIAPRSEPVPPAPPLSLALRSLWMCAMILIVAAWAVMRRKQPGVSRWPFTLVPFIAALLLMLAMAGCGGGGGGGGGGVAHDPGTPAGTYTLTVTGTSGSGSATLSHSMALTLNVT